MVNNLILATSSTVSSLGLTFPPDAIIGIRCAIWILIFGLALFSICMIIYKLGFATAFGDTQTQGGALTAGARFKQCIPFFITGITVPVLIGIITIVFFFLSRSNATFHQDYEIWTQILSW